MLLTVTPNAGLDKTYLMDAFAVGRVHRPREVWLTAGGKGINVARVTRRLGGEALATGFLGGHTGGVVRDRLSVEGIPEAFVNVAGESRLCIAMIDTVARTQTEVNEPGPVISDAEMRAFRVRYAELIQRAHTVALCGSLPPGVPDDFYAALITEAKARGCVTLLDTSGDALKYGLESVPDIVKPNAVEVKAILGDEIETVGEAAEAGRALLNRGVRCAAVTLGRCGAVVVDANGAWYAEPPEVEFQSAVGSGDAFVAAFLHVLGEERPAVDALRYGTAAGAANAGTYGAGMLEKHTVENIAPRVNVTPIG